MNEIAKVGEGGPVAISEGPGALLSAIVQLAKDPDFDVAKLGKLVEMQERLEDRQAERLFTEALRQAQSEIPQIEKHGTVELGAGKGSYAFARLEDMDRVLRPLMARHGFSIYFDREQREGGGLIVTATLSHVAGHSKKASFPLPLDTGPGRNNLQAAGSTDSYARRYLWEGFFNIVRKGRDDDGKLGGTKFITDEQADELLALMKEVGRQEGQFLDNMFAGKVRSVNEIEEAAYLPVKNTLLGIQRQQQARKGSAT